MKAAYSAYSASCVRPKGWLARQLRLQAEGLAGNLDRIWPDVRDSQWIGGDREGWERVPYWLDGFVPLAWLLDDEDLKRRAQRYIDSIIANQQADGWLCPCKEEERNGYDVWALFLILKVLTGYADASGDDRVEEVVYRACKNLWQHLSRSTLFRWGSARWFEALIPILWMRERRPEPWLTDLGQRLRMMGMSWETMIRAPYWHEPNRVWTYDTHVVNLAMAIKSGGLCALLNGERDGSESELFLRELRKYHSTCWGLFTGDECLAGASPIQGTELCAVVEAMYSFETLLCATGDPVWGDRLEELAFNALPATCSADMWTHQYDQCSNQPACEIYPNDHVFMTNGCEAGIFGLEPNYGCCTANHGQGWPKFALHALLRDEDGVFCAVPVPAELKTRIGGTAVTVSVETDYPFRDTVKYTVTADAPADFALKIRIPGSAAGAELDGIPVNPGTVVTVRRSWSGETTVLLTLRQETKLEARPENLRCVRRGPLVYSVPVKAEKEMLEYVREGVERKFPYCDWLLHTASPWEWAFTGDAFRVVELGEVPEMPFDPERPPVGLETELVPIDWGREPGYEPAAARVPVSRKAKGEKHLMTLVPYGCTDLRMTELPIAEK